MSLYETIINIVNYSMQRRCALMTDPRSESRKKVHQKAKHAETKVCRHGGVQTGLLCFGFGMANPVFPLQSESTDS